MWQTAREFISRTPYRQEMISVVVVKLLMLMVLWWVCFSHPVKHELTPGKVAERLFSD